MSVTLLKAGEHSCVGHLSQGAEPVPGTNRTRLEKAAMLVYCGKFQSLDGEVEITEGHIDKLVANHNAKIDAHVKNGMKEINYFTKLPPLQLDHSTSARDTVGRVNGTLSKGRFMREDGVEVCALMVDRLCVLGEDNVEHVLDGRWANLSIGADLDAGQLNELSITPFPAAAHATMLAKKRMNDWKTDSKGSYKGFPYVIETDDNRFYGHIDSVQFEGRDSVEVLEMMKAHIDRKPPKITKMGEAMHEKLRKHMMEKHKMSEKDADDHLGKMKKHLEKKLGDAKKVEDHLAALSDDDMKHLADDVHEEDKKLAAEEDEKKKKLAAEEEEKKKKLAESTTEREGDALGKKMAAARPKLIELSKAVKTGLVGGQAKLKEQSILGKMARLRAAAKMSPAEQKKVDVVELAKKTDAEVAAYFKGFEEREPVILTGIVGTTRALSAANLARLSAKSAKIRLEAETKKDMGHELTAEEKAALKEVDAIRMGAAHDESTEDTEGHDEMMKHLQKMLESYDQRDAVLAHVKKLLESKHRMGAEAPVVSEDHEKHMSALAENYSRLQNEFQALVEMVGELTGIKSADLE